MELILSICPKPGTKEISLKEVFWAKRLTNLEVVSHSTPASSFKGFISYVEDVTPDIDRPMFCSISEVPSA